MVDKISKQKRSWNMSRINSKNTEPEKIVRSFLFKNGFRFRLHSKTLPGKPDIVIPKYKTIIEVQGCFWHQHQNCKYAHPPKSNTEYWENKFSKSQALRRQQKMFKVIKK